MELDEVADELYGVPPEEFVALRTARQDEARAAGNRVLAKQIGALPKPTSAAWACNLLVRVHREEIEALVELGGLLREAQENLAGEQLRALGTQRSQLLAALSRQASALARQHGRPVSSGVSGQVEETLRAAMADPEAGRALLAGRLPAPLSYSGLGTATARPDLRLVPSPAPQPHADPHPDPPPERPRGGRADAAERRRRREEESRRAAEERRRRELEEAREAAEAAEEAAREAEAAAAGGQQEVADLRERRDRIAARAAELDAELARLREEEAATAEDLRRAEGRARTARRRAGEAAAGRDRALARVEELSRSGG